MQITWADKIIHVLVSLRVDRLCSPLLGGRGSILMFHRVVEVTEGSPRLHNDAAEITCDYLEMVLGYIKAHYRVIPIGEVVDYLRSGEGKQFTCLTFDDGYRDTYTLAYPILKKHGLPFTLYVCTAFPDKKAILWHYALEDLVLRSEVVDLEYRGERRAYAARSHQEKLVAYERLWDQIFSAAPEEQAELWDKLFQRGGIDVNRYTRELTADWEQIRAMSKDDLVTIGAHGVSHTPLARLPAEGATREITQSRDVIQSRIGTPVEHFSYPYGSSGAAGEREFEIVRRLGFKTATTTRQGCVLGQHLDHPEQLPRLDVGRSRADLLFLRSQLSGLRETAKRAARLGRSDVR